MPPLDDPAMEKKQRVWVTTALGVAVLVVAGGVVAVLAPAHGADATQLTASVKQGVVSSSVTADGTLAPAEETQVDFAVGGTVAAVDVAPGQVVQAGATLATLDTGSLSAAVTNAQAALTDDEDAEGDERTAADTTTASSAGGSSSTQAQTALLADESKVTSDETALTAAQTALSDATLTAPVAGEVLQVSGSVGQQVSAGGTVTSTGSGSGSGATTGSGSAAGSATSSVGTGGSAANQGFVTIAETGSDTVTADVPEADIASLTAGQTATVTFPAAPSVTATAKVTSIAPAGTTTDALVEFPVVLTLTAVPKGVRYGETADVAVTTKSSAADALSVPSAAVHTVDGRSTVTVVGKDGRTTTVQVTTGIVGDDGTQVSSPDLHPGDAVSIGTISATTRSTGGSGTGTAGTGRGTGGYGSGGYSSGGYGSGRGSAGGIGTGGAGGGGTR